MTIAQKKEEKNSDEYDFEIDYKIENVVATVTVEMEDEDRIDLTKIARSYVDVEYNPERFPGLVMRIKEPRATLLIFSTGKMVVTGMRKESEAESVVEQAVQKVKDAGVKIKNPQIKIENIVASGKLHTLVDLNMGAIVLERAMYEPEVFPGLIYRMEEPKTVFLIFSTGTIVCTGTKYKEDIHKGVIKLNKEIRRLDLDRDPLQPSETEELTFI